MWFHAPPPPPPPPPKKKVVVVVLHASHHRFHRHIIGFIGSFARGIQGARALIFGVIRHVVYARVVYAHSAEDGGDGEKL